MPDPSGRRITIADCLVLVAALGLGFAFVRMTGHDGPTRSMPIVIASSVMFSLMIALIVLTFFEPRASRRDSFRGPGILACTSVLLGTAITFAVDYSNLHPHDIATLLDVMLGYQLFEVAALMILSCWFTSTMLGQWRWPHQWKESVAFIIAVGWVGLFAYSEVRTLIGMP